MAKDTYGIALGMIETRGLVPAIEAAGAMSRGWSPRTPSPAPHRELEPALGDEMRGNRPARS